jgi:cyclase
MNQDGVRNGYDIEQLAYIRESCEVPLVASGGAGKLQDFEEVLKKASVSAALAAGVFHDGEITIPDLKRFLSKAGVEVRL